MKFASTLLGSAAVLLLTGCASTLEKVGDATSGPTVLRGSHAAVGGVTYVPKAHGNPVWDKQVTSCRFNPKSGYTFSGYDAALLSYAPDAAEPRVVLYGPQGTVRLSSVACGVKLTLKDAGNPQAGKISMMCQEAGYDLVSGVRFERCGD